MLPSLTLGIFYAAYLARLTRGGMMEIQSGLHPHRPREGGGRGTRHHETRPARRVVAGGQFPRAGAGGDHQRVVRGGEDFQIPGLGQQFVTSATNRDHTMILGTVIFFAVLIIFFNLLVDVVQVFLNPRLRFE